MSRHIFNTKDGKPVAYGFDRPLEEYFLQVFDPKKEEHESIILDWGTNSVYSALVGRKHKSRMNIYDKLVELGCPDEDNLAKLAFDLPF